MKQTLIVIVLTFCSFYAMAQYRVYGLFGNDVQGNLISSGTSNSIIIGNSTTTGTGVNSVIIGNGTASTSNTGTGNTFVGQGTGVTNTTGNHNVFMGQGSGIQNTSGAHNVFVGKDAGSLVPASGVFTQADGNETGIGNTALGSQATFLNTGLINATVIGSSARASQSNSLILGRRAMSGLATVQVGIGTEAPQAHLHLKSEDAAEDVLFETADFNGVSTLKMRAGNNIARFFMNGSGVAGTFITPNVGPLIATANMGGLVTDGNSLAIGVEGSDNSGSLHFISHVADASMQFTRQECMRVNHVNGFVGVHTLTSASSGGTGEPQALFHVNLTNPINSNLNTNKITQGIRFEGLPAYDAQNPAYANHNEMILLDGNGNLARAPYTANDAWLLDGNANTLTSTPPAFIGTLDPDDFRIRTHNAQVARFTSEGNFDLAPAIAPLVSSNNITAASATSAAMGTSNTLDGATSSIITGASNTIENSTYSAAFGESNTIDALSSGCEALGNGNVITDADHSATFGRDNRIDNSIRSFAGGYKCSVTNQSNDILLYGNESLVSASEYSGAIGEKNTMTGGHGCFIGGGHNTSNGRYHFIGGDWNDIQGENNYTLGGHNVSVGNYNLLLGNHMIGDASSSTAVSPMPTTDSYIMMIGDYINSNLKRSLSVGFNGNRTTVTNERGMSVQIDPTSGTTDVPVVNFEVEAGVTTTGRQALSGLPPGVVYSNVRFHNLPTMPQHLTTLPAVVIDPNTGELFRTNTTGYSKPGKSGSSEDVEALKEKISELESQLSMYDEKFAQLERALNQICESGCEGLKTHTGDVLFQSVPNPTGNNATISYYLSRNYAEANIVLYSADGRIIHSYVLNPIKGDGSVNISLGDISQGTYLYRLVVDGRYVEVKKLQKQ